MASALLRQGVGTVLAMSHAMLVDMTRELMSASYDALRFVLTQRKLQFKAEELPCAAVSQLKWRPTMMPPTVEDRLQRLEKLVDEVLQRLPAAPKKDWRRTIGMFDDDPVMKEIIDDALRARERERREFYDQFDKQTT